MTQVQPNILIVEDDFISLEVLKAMLSCYAVTVRSATTAAQAVKLATKLPPTLLLLDHELPDMTGVALFQQLAKELPTVQAALISSHDVAHLLDDAKAVGITQVLSKPLEPHQLTDLLRITGCIE